MGYRTGSVATIVMMIMDLEDLSSESLRFFQANFRKGERKVCPLGIRREGSLSAS